MVLLALGNVENNPFMGKPGGIKLTSSDIFSQNCFLAKATHYCVSQSFFFTGLYPLYLWEALGKIILSLKALSTLHKYIKMKNPSLAKGYVQKLSKQNGELNMSKETLTHAPVFSSNTIYGKLKFLYHYF